MSSIGTNTGSDPSSNAISATVAPVIAASTTPSEAAATTVPAPRGDPPADYNSVFGKALNLAVPSEAPTDFSIQVTGLPTNGTVVLPDGRTPVTVGQRLTPAQAAGLRFKSNGAAQSSRFDFDEVMPGRPPNPKSINLPFDSKTNTVTPTTTALTAAPDTTATSAAITTSGGSNSIVLENQKPGTSPSTWQIAPGGDSTKIQGFTTSISTPVGGTVQFKIDNQTGNGTYQVSIYRLGYYGGAGATLVTTLNHSGSPVVQPNPLVDSTTGLVDAGNWSVTDSWAVPSTATSGVYVADVVDGSQKFQIPFIISNPSSTSDIVFQTSDETWQAYNGYGGANLYGGNGPANPPAPNYGQGAAFGVSYNRPIVTRDSIGTYAGPQDSLFGAEYAAIYWLEENGYDVSYISGIDTATNGSLLLNHKVFMDAGHDEYWTANQVANVQAAADKGVNLAFLSGNEIFWKTRLSPSTDSSATPNRTLVTYKDTHFNQEIDPSGTATGTFEDPRLGSAPEPSNEVSGTFFQVDQTADTLGIQIPYGESKLRFWRNTNVANTAPGQTASLQPALLGYEWDSSPDNTFMPDGLVYLSSTTVDESTAYNTNFGNVDTSGTATNNLVEYRDPTSGALVFGVGTVFWSWGLSNQHDNSPSPYSSQSTDPNVQQSMINVLADMGVQPQTLQSTLVIASQSTDTTRPTSTISAVSSTSVVEGQTVTVSGIATDAGGGVIGGVQISTDGGTTWHLASGQVGSASMNWTYSFAALAPGTYTIKSRAVDDSLNLEAPGTGVSYTVTPSSAVNIFDPSTTPSIANDPKAIEVGVKFTAATSGLISGIRFYKGTANTGTHVGDLWSSSGTLLATATFTNESASGWQQVNFSNPVSAAVGMTYIASYHTNTGDYADTPYYFATYQGQSNGSLNAPGKSLNGYTLTVPTALFPTPPQLPATISGSTWCLTTAVTYRRCSAMLRRRPPILSVGLR